MGDRMFKLGVDIDGSINDFSDLIYKCAIIFNESQGIDKLPDMSDYIIERFFEWSEYQNTEFWTKFYKLALTNTIPLAGVVETLSLLKRKGIALYFITARVEKYRELTLSWLKKHNIPMDNLIMSKNKAQACLENNIAIMVEDEPENCVSISEHIPVLCMSYPYNQHLEEVRNIKRISNWAEAYREIMLCYNALQVS